jgi:hypothetical protein
MEVQMSPAQVVLALLGMAPVRSLTIQAGKVVVTTLIESRPSAYARVSQNRPPVRRRPHGKKRPRFVAPGYVRVAIPALLGEAQWAEDLEGHLLCLDGVREVRANPHSGRVLIVFDPLVIDYATIDRLLEEHTLSRLEPEQNGVLATA